MSNEREKLLAIHSALDDALGDSDVTHVEDDDELRSEHPVQWAAQKLMEFIDRAGPAATPASSVQLSELDDASNACLELAAKHGLATGHGDTVADMIREFSGQIRPPSGSAGAMREALELCLRGLTAAMTYGGVSGPIFDKAIETARAALAAPQAQESVTADDVRKTITDEWGSSLCYRNSFGTRSCEQDNPNLGCRCGDIAKAIMADYSVSRPLHPRTENTAAGEASTTPPDR